MASREPPHPLSGALGSALQAVARALSNLPAPAMLIGGMAVIARGVPRVTRDIDATVAGTAVNLADLLHRLGEHGLVPRIGDARAFADVHQVLLLRHEATGIDVDLSLASLPFELEALDAAEPVEIGGVPVRVARPEDLVVYKAVAFRPQDQQDIERLLTLYPTSIDLARVRRLVGQFAEALDDPDRPAALERIIERVGLR
jgi:Nucleotidyltransferase of unknown function (DUF6036)